MKPIPQSINEHIANARHYLQAADKHIQPAENAIIILLLLVGWENIVIADHELSAWATEADIDPSILKSHASKLKHLPKVTRVIVGPNGTKPKVVEFSTGHAFEELRMAAQYGSNTESKNVEEIFKKGWDLDELRNGLINKIGWVEVVLKTQRALLEDITKSN